MIQLKSNVYIKCLHHPEGNILKLSEKSCVTHRCLQHPLFTAMNGLRFFTGNPSIACITSRLQEVATLLMTELQLPVLLEAKSVYCNKSLESKLVSFQGRGLRANTQYRLCSSDTLRTSAVFFQLLLFKGAPDPIALPSLVQFFSSFLFLDVFLKCL